MRNTIFVFAILMATITAGDFGLCIPKVTFFVSEILDIFTLILNEGIRQLFGGHGFSLFDTQCR
jgi:hypothetical protein